jgi:hypothetical protein
VLLDRRGIDLGRFDTETSAMHAAWAVADIAHCRIELDLEETGSGAPAPTPLIEERALDAIDFPTGRVLPHKPTDPSPPPDRTDDELDTDPPGGLRKLWERAAQLPLLAEFVPEALRSSLASTVPTEPEQPAPSADTDPQMASREVDDDVDPLDDTAARPATADEAKFRLDAQGVGYLPLGVPIPHIDTEDEEATMPLMLERPASRRPATPRRRFVSLERFPEPPPAPSPWDSFFPVDAPYVVPQDLEPPEEEEEEEITGEVEPIPLEKPILRQPVPRQASSDPGK